MTRGRRILVVLAGLLVPLALALAWLLGTTSGLRFALARAEHASGGALSVQQSSGRLAGPLVLDGLRFHAKDGPDVRAARIELDLDPWALLLGRVHLDTLHVQGLDVALPDTGAPTSSSAPFDPRAPLHLVVDSAELDGLRVHRGATDLFVARRVMLAGAWTRSALSVKTLRVRAADGSIDLAAQVAFASGYRGSATGNVDWRAGGRRWRGTLEAKSDGRRANASVALAAPSAAHAELSLATRAPYAWTARLTLPRGASDAWLGKDSAIKQLAATLQAHGDAHQLHATGTVDIDAARVQLAALDAKLGANNRQVQLEHLQLRSPPHAGTLDASGSIDLAGSAPAAKLHVAWQGVTVPASVTGNALATHGTLDLDGTPGHFLATLDAMAGKARITAKASGTPDRIEVDQLAVQQAKGRLDAHGTLHVGAPTEWQLALTAKRFDPGLLLPRWHGALDATLTGRGDAGGASLDLQTLGGTLRGQPVSGHGKLALSSARVLSGRMALALGDGHVRMSGARGARNDIDVDLRLDALGRWIDGAGGAVSSSLKLSGKWPRLAVRGSVDGTALAWHDQSAAWLAARIDVPDLQTPGGKLHLAGQDLHAGGFQFKTLTLDASGNARSHSLEASASGDPLSLRVALDGGLHGKAWNGKLTRLDLKLAGRPDWRLEAPAALAWGGGTASLGKACLSAGKPRLCLAAERGRQGELKASYRLHEVPLALVLALAGNDLPMRARGTLDGDGQVTRSAAGALTGQANLGSARGALAYVDHPGEPLLDYRKLDATLQLAPGHRQLRVTAVLQQTGALDGLVRMQGPHNALDGHVRVRLDNLRFVELFTTAVANLQGHLDADLAVGGTLAAPTLGGTATAADIAGEVPALGLKLHGGRLSVSGNQDSALRIDGQVQSGKGTLQVSGSAGLGAGQDTQLALRGRQVQVADIPSATVSLSPDVRVVVNASGVRIGGKVSVDKAKVALEKLPGAGVTEASPDVVVVDARQPATPRGEALPVTTDLAVDLGDKTHVTGYGLDGNLQGSLRVTSRPGQQAQGQGQIGIDGTFRAYGQDLNITRGRLLFAASPLDNPGLDIRAVRKLNPNATVDDGQEVGLEVHGTAQRPQLTVFSNPAMEQSDALSYLITGKPLSQVKSGEGSSVDAAAQALGSATGDLLAKSVGSRLGISDIGVSGNDALGTTAFTVGKYLSPRLYLSYGVGLFEPGQVVTLRYILSRRWNFEAQQSTESSRASFNYRYEH